MKILIIGGNRFVGLRLAKHLEDQGYELHVFNRTGQSPHLRRSVIYKGDRANLALSHLDRDWDAIFDFACFSEADARESLHYFRTVKRYVLISTVSVYDLGADLSERMFAPQEWDLSQPALREGHVYQDGKRRAEAVFNQSPKFPTVMVRFPTILGPDDYTQRLNFHIERIAHNKPFHVSSRSHRLSMIHAEDACEFLAWCLNQTFTGPVNVASSKPIALGKLIEMIEMAVGRKALLLDRDPGDLGSPYDPEGDYFVNTDLAKSYGFEARPIDQWLPDLIEASLPESAAPAKRPH
jgi:nucleoside-diphosphate-sugar epimerase